MNRPSRPERLSILSSTSLIGCFPDEVLSGEAFEPAGFVSSVKVSQVGKGGSLPLGFATIIKHLRYLSADMLRLSETMLVAEQIEKVSGAIMRLALLKTGLNGCTKS